MTPSDVLKQLPPYLFRAARIQNIVISERPRASNEMAQYEHGTRNIYVLPGLNADQIRKAMFHEIAHAIDDNFSVGHYFGESPAWAHLCQQLAPNLPTIEVFAEHMSQYLQGERSTIPPVVARFLAQALSYLERHFTAFRNSAI